MDDRCQRRIEYILGLIPVGVAQFDEQQRCLFVNKQFESHFGTAGDRPIGKALWEVIGTESYETLRPSVMAALGGTASEETSLWSRAGAPIHCRVHLVPELSRDDGRAPGFLFLSVDETSRAESEGGRELYERGLREALIKEVHHRLKNSLQGVIGLLRLHAMRRPELSGAVDEAINQLQATVAIFGISARANGTGIALCDIVTEIARNVGYISRMELAPICDASILAEPVLLAAAHRTSIGLVANELLSNAIKHSGGTTTAQVEIRLEREGGVAHLRILARNARLPPGFDFAAGRGLGNGLDLVKLLLPAAGCDLVIKSVAQGVLADLSLWPPVVTLG